MQQRIEALSIEAETLRRHNISLRAHRDELNAELEKQDAEIAELKESLLISFQLLEMRSQKIEDMHGGELITAEHEKRWLKMSKKQERRR